MPWTPEIGIRASFAKVTVNDVDVTVIGLPSGGGIEGYGAASAIYGVIPVADRFAIEPSFGYQEVSSGTTATLMTAGARVLFSAWRGLYVAAGPTVVLVKQGGEESSRLGGNVAAGYRLRLTGAVTGRAEVFYETTAEDADFGLDESSAIGLALGFGMGLGGDAPATVTGDAMWDLAIGVQGGYTHVSVPGQVDFSGFTLPGGGASAGLGIPITTIAPFFVIIPVGERFALEPSFSYQSYSVEDDVASGSFYNVGLKGNYALNRAMYLGLSAEYSGVGGDDLDGVDGSTGVGAVFGFNFDLIDRLRGRLEGNYRVFSGGDNSIFGDYQAFGFSFGVMAPLK